MGKGIGSNLIIKKKILKKQLS